MSTAECFGSLLQPQVAALLEEDGVNIVDPRVGSGCTASGSVDRCTILISICAATVQWELVWSSEVSGEPPDFIFHEGCEEFLSLSSLKSLQTYDINIASSTADLVREVRAAFYASEVERVRRVADETVKFELSTVVEWPGMQAMLSDMMSPMEVHITLPLTITPEASPAEATASQPKEQQGDVVRVNMVLYVGSSTRAPSPRLLDLEKHSWLEGYTLPGWPSERCAMEYVVGLQDNLVARYHAHERKHRLRAAYCDALVAAFGHPLERDVGNTKVAFHFVHQNFVIIIQFKTSMEFPERMPDIMVSSLIATRNGKCFSSTYNSYPYSPRWEVSELVARHRAFLLEALPGFKNLCQQQHQY